MLLISLSRKRLELLREVAGADRALPARGLAPHQPRLVTKKRATKPARTASKRHVQSLVAPAAADSAVRGFGVFLESWSGWPPVEVRLPRILALPCTYRE